MSISHRCAILAGLALLPGICIAGTYTVRPDGSGDYPTVQAALNAALSGDEIVLTDGTFTGPGNWDLDFGGKTLVVRSQSGDPSTCTISCGGSHRAFLFNNNEVRGALVAGITMVDAQYGALVIHSSPTFRRCAFHQCHSVTGSAAAVETGFPLFEECDFSSGIICWSGCYGGALYVNSGNMAVDRCTFQMNGAEFGGAIYARDSHVELRDTIVHSNYASYGSAIYCAVSTLDMTRCTLDGNGDGAQISLRFGSALNADHSIIANGLASIACLESTALLHCSDVFGNTGGDWVDCIAGQENGEGNLNVDPLFCDETQGDLTLRSDSPCAAENNTECDQIGALGIGCDSPVPVRDATWGSIKGSYR
jgi:hypothetical protein